MNWQTVLLNKYIFLIRGVALISYRLLLSLYSGDSKGWNSAKKYDAFLRKTTYSIELSIEERYGGKNKILKKDQFLAKIPDFSKISWFCLKFKIQKIWKCSKYMIMGFPFNGNCTLSLNFTPKMHIKCLIKANLSVKAWVEGSWRGIQSSYSITIVCNDLTKKKNQFLIQYHAISY